MGYMKGDTYIWTDEDTRQSNSYRGADKQTRTVFNTPGAEIGKGIFDKNTGQQVTAAMMGTPTVTVNGADYNAMGGYSRPDITRNDVIEAMRAATTGGTYQATPPVYTSNGYQGDDYIKNPNYKTPEYTVSGAEGPYTVSGAAGPYGAYDPSATYARMYQEAMGQQLNPAPANPTSPATPAQPAPSYQGDGVTRPVGQVNPVTPPVTQPVQQPVQQPVMTTQPGSTAYNPGAGYVQYFSGSGRSNPYGVPGLTITS